MNNTKAIILVGGQGSRLRPLTISTPKPLLSVNGKPIIVHQIEQLRDAGIKEIVLATSFKAEMFSQELGDGSKLGVKIDYAFEESPLGTGGAIRNAYDKLNDATADVLVFNGDIITGIDISDMVDSFKRANFDILLYLTKVENPRAFGLVPTEADGKVISFLEKPKTDEEIVTNQINAGCYLFKAGTIGDLIPSGEVVSVERDTFPNALAANLKLGSYISDKYWLDLGTPSSYIQCSKDMVKGLVINTTPSDYYAHKSLKSGTDVTISDGSFVAKDVVIGDNSKVIGSSIAEGVSIGANSIIENCIIGRHARIAERVKLSGVIVGELSMIGSDNELTDGARVWDRTLIPSKAIRFSTDS